MKKGFRIGLIVAGATVLVAAIGVFSVGAVERYVQKERAEQRTALLRLIEGANLEAIKQNTPSIDFRLNALDGKSVSLASLRGKVVLLNFWATWCPPCQVEIPALETLYSTYRSRGLVVLGVDVAEDDSAVKAFAAKNGMTFPILLDRTTHVSALYGLSGIPSSFLIDKKGNVDSVAEGPQVWSSAQTSRLVEALLRQ